VKIIVNALRIPILALLATAVFGMASCLRTDTVAEEQWLTSIHTSQEWAVFPCKNYLVTNVCATDKDYSDPGSLPPIISVGDTVSYTDKNNKQKQFVVRHISFFVYGKDVDSTYGGQRLTAKKGETSCDLFDAETQSAPRRTDFLSKIVVRGCRALP